MVVRLTGILHSLLGIGFPMLNNPPPRTKIIGPLLWTVVMSTFPILRGAVGTMIPSLGIRVN